jgi:ABC-type tungstate transport system substrate-binding protein
MDFLLDGLYQAVMLLLNGSAETYAAIKATVLVSSYSMSCSLLVGISMMVGGNIKWHTRTITTAIALETNKGQFAMGVALGLVLLLIAFVVNFSAAFLRHRR